jgi:DNA mismatch repair ATPase MutL
MKLKKKKLKQKKIKNHLILTWFESISLIPNKFNFEWWNHEKKINLKKFPKKKKQLKEWRSNLLGKNSMEDEIVKKK